MKEKNYKGITLIALVITIIVLLVLAGVALSLIMGENGITERAVNAGKTQNMAGAKEQFELEVANLGGEFYQAKYVNGEDVSLIQDYILGKLNSIHSIGDYELKIKGNKATLKATKGSDRSTATATIDENGKVIWEGTTIASEDDGSNSANLQSLRAYIVGNNLMELNPDGISWLPNENLEDADEIETIGWSGYDEIGYVFLKFDGNSYLVSYSNETMEGISVDLFQFDTTPLDYLINDPDLPDLVFDLGLGYVGDEWITSVYEYNENYYSIYWGDFYDSEDDSWCNGIIGIKIKHFNFDETPLDYLINDFNLPDLYDIGCTYLGWEGLKSIYEYEGNIYDVYFCEWYNSQTDNYDYTIIGISGSAITTYTVTFYDDDKTTVLDSCTVIAGNTVNYTASKDNYEIECWKTIDGDNEFTTSTPVNSDISVYAKWKTRYAVTFYDSDKSTILNTIYVTEGRTVYYRPTKENYVFECWKTVDGDNEFTSSTKVNSELSVYAKWKNTYVVTFYDSDKSTILNTCRITEGTTVNYAPTKANYQLSGWKTIDGDEEFTAGTIVNSDVNVYAEWKRTYLVEFYDSDKVTNLCNWVLPEGSTLSYVPKKNGKIFECWKTMDGDNELPSDTQVFSELSVYAKWEGDVSVTGVTLNMKSLVLNEGTSKNLTATVTPSKATNKRVTWSSSNTSVATVNSNGKVTGITPGNAIITVTTLDGSKTAKCNVTVIDSSKIYFGLYYYTGINEEYYCNEGSTWSNANLSGFDTSDGYVWKNMPGGYVYDGNRRVLASELIEEGKVYDVEDN